MVSKDQGIGGAILAVCVIVAIVYVLLVCLPQQLFGLNGTTVRLDAVLVLVSIAFIAILAIGAWIGWTMATTPPPKPIEEITAEVEVEEKKEEPKAETKAEEPAPAKPAEAPATDSTATTTKKKK
jgi:predicted DNA-binding transcriptional regulator